MINLLNFNFIFFWIFFVKKNVQIIYILSRNFTLQLISIYNALSFSFQQKRKQKKEKTKSSRKGFIYKGIIKDQILNIFNLFGIACNNKFNLFKPHNLVDLKSRSISINKYQIDSPFTFLFYIVESNYLQRFKNYRHQSFMQHVQKIRKWCKISNIFYQEIDDLFD